MNFNVSNGRRNRESARHLKIAKYFLPLEFTGELLFVLVHLQRIVFLCKIEAIKPRIWPKIMLKVVGF